MSQFATKLLEKQGAMSGAEFARLLGISAADVSRIKCGKRQPSKAIINAALGLWPELAYWVAQDAKAAREKEVA